MMWHNSFSFPPILILNYVARGTMHIKYLQIQHDSRWMSSLQTLDFLELSLQSSGDQIGLNMNEPKGTTAQAMSESIYIIHDVMIVSRGCSNKDKRRKFRSQTSDSMDRWKSRGGFSQRREEERRSEKRRMRSRKTQVREKVAKSRFSMFFQWFVASKDRKVGSLKRRVPSHVIRWEMKNCTPLWR